MIKLNDIFAFQEIQKYKIYFSKGLHSWLKSQMNFQKEFVEYQSQDKFKDFIISFADFGDGNYIFTGIFKVLISQKSDRTGSNPTHYQTQLMAEYENFIGRLIVKNEKRKGDLNYIYQAKKERLDKIEVIKILENRYEGENFCGYENINHSFTELSNAINKEDWKTALTKMRGVYLLFDKETGKKYVGSACNEDGFWGRWNQYINNPNGGNKKLKKLKDEYIKKNFTFTILEYFTHKTNENDIIKRESFWKNSLKTREFGYNDN